MKKSILSLAIIMAMVSCSKDLPKEEEIQQKELLTRTEINAIIESSLQSTGNFQWKEAKPHVIWSAAKLGNMTLTVGYGNAPDEFQKSINSKEIKSELLQIIAEKEGIAKKSKQSIAFFEDEHLNVFDIKITQLATIKALLKHNKIRYLEPSDYQLEAPENVQARSSGGSGCGFDAATLNSNDYRTIAPGAKIPWSFDVHKIPQAWNYSTGTGITVAIIDTGLSSEQKWMNQYFNDGYSSGRTVQKYGTYIESIWPWSNNYDGVNDKCGHGTSMAAVATAPRNNNYLPVGVAYNANLISYRAVKNVVIDDYHEKKGVADALKALANRNDVKIISMSLGYPFSIGRVSDAVKYAHGKGKMILAAGGTSTSFTTWYGVIFPASMSETVAVTGIKEGSYTKCDVCHSGSKIDFTVTMQRTNGTSNKVPVLSYYNGQTDYVGGSSVATATTAGIAALVWAKHPTWTRSQVLQKMKQAADFYPNKHSQYGYGNIDVLKAVQ